MLPLFLCSFFFAGSFRELGALLSPRSNTAFSPKDYLTLESQHHPSWVLRRLFHYLLLQMRSGKTLSQLVRPLGLTLPEQSTNVFDLKQIFTALGTEHPVEYPWDTLFRLTIVSLFKSLSQRPALSDPLWLILLGLSVALSKEQWEWGWYKVRLTELYCWECDLRAGMNFQQGLMQPKFVKNPWERKVWRQISALDRDLEQSAELFATYWRNHYFRQALLHRRTLKGVLQIATLLLFIATITPILAGFYQGDLLA